MNQAQNEVPKNVQMQFDAIQTHTKNTNRANVLSKIYNNPKKQIIKHFHPGQSKMTEGSIEEDNRRAPRFGPNPGQLPQMAQRSPRGQKA